MLTRLRLGPKLLLAPAIAVVLLALLSGSAWYVLLRQHQVLDNIVGQRAARMRAASELVLGAQRGHAQVYQLHAWIGGSFPAQRITPLIAAIERQHAHTRAGLAALGAMTAPGGAERHHVDGAAASHAAYVRVVLDVIELSRDDPSVSASAMQRAETAFDEVAGRLDALAQLEGRLSQEASRRAAAAVRAISILAPCVIVLAVLLSLVVTVAVRRTLLTEIRGIGAAAAGLANGDLSIAVGVPGKDEIAETSRVLNAGIRNLSGTLRTVCESARAIGSASRELALGSLNLGARAPFRASSLEQTSTSMRELAATVQLTRGETQAAQGLARAANGAARDGEEAVDRLLGTFAALARTVRQLDGLGARIEAAARASADAGAVPARAALELRRLAGQLLGGIEDGRRGGAQAAASMETLSVSVRQLGEVIGRIGSASAGQASGLSEVSQAIVQMDQVTRRNALLVEEAAASARTLQTQALVLARAVGVLRLDESAQPAAPSSVADHDLRERLRDGRRDASLPGPGERKRGHLQLASRRD